MRDGQVITKSQIENNKDWELIGSNPFLKSETYVNFKLELLVTFYNSHLGTIDRYE